MAEADPPSEAEVGHKRIRNRRPDPAPPPAESVHVFRVNEDGSPRFSPLVTHMTAKAGRTIRTGQYESFEISTMATFEPDRRFTIVENVSKLNTLVTDEVNRMASEIAAQFEVNK